MHSLTKQLRGLEASEKQLKVEGPRERDHYARMLNEAEQRAKEAEGLAEKRLG